MNVMMVHTAAIVQHHFVLIWRDHISVSVEMDMRKRIDTRVLVSLFNFLMSIFILKQF